MSELTAEQLVRSRYESAWSAGGIWIEGPMGCFCLGTSWRGAWRMIERADKLAERNRKRR